IRDPLVTGVQTCALPIFAVSVVQRLQGAGFQALWAGGCVRDELLGLVPKDYDVATDARPEQVQQLFRRTVAVGVSFGVVEVLGQIGRASCRAGWVMWGVG